jgi:hypothetical protein
MKILNIILLGCFILYSQQTLAGDTTTFSYSHKKEVCLNATALLSQFVPFNLSETEMGLQGIKTKWYGRKYAFRTSLGIIADDNILTQGYLSLGYEKRKPIYKKFTYTTGWDYFVFLKKSSVVFRDVEAAVGIGKFYGLEYNINERIFIGTEAQVMLGVGTTTLIKTQTPTNIFICVRI